MILVLPVPDWKKFTFSDFLKHVAQLQLVKYICLENKDDALNPFV